MEKEELEAITVVYIEAVMMTNGELIHHGKSLGWVSERQRNMVYKRACKLTKGSEPIVALEPNIA